MNTRNDLILGSGLTVYESSIPRRNQDPQENYLELSRKIKDKGEEIASVKLINMACNSAHLFRRGHTPFFEPGGIPEHWENYFHTGNVAAYRTISDSKNFTRRTWDIRITTLDDLNLSDNPKLTHGSLMVALEPLHNLPQLNGLYISPNPHVIPVLQTAPVGGFVSLDLNNRGLSLPA